MHVLVPIYLKGYLFYDGSTAICYREFINSHAPSHLLYRRGGVDDDAWMHNPFPISPHFHLMNSGVFRQTLPQ